MDSLRCVRESSDIGLSDAELELELQRHRDRDRDHQREHEHHHDHNYDQEPSGAVPPSADQVSARTNEEGDADGHGDGIDADAASAKYTTGSAHDDSDLDCTLPAAPDRTSQPPRTGAASPSLSFTRSSVRSAIRGSRLTPSIRNASPITSPDLSHQVLWQPPVRTPSKGQPSSLHSSTVHCDDYPRYPDQSFAVLQAQDRLSDNVPPWLRGQPPSQYHPADSTRALATAGSGSASGSGRPAPGLFVDQPIRLNIIDHDRRPPSSFAYPSSIPEPKETHTVAVDIDEQTGNKLINEYEIVGELGRGEHGKVKLGVHGKTGRKVAIKVVQRYSKRRRLGKLGNPEDKVKKEVAILKKARHPNVVSLLEVIDDSNQQKAYIVLEYVENGEIIWRRKGVEEIVIVDKKRLEREKRGVSDTQSFIADSQQFVEYARLQREKQRRERRSRRKEGKRKSANPYGWSLEYGGDTDEELTDDHNSVSSEEPASSTSPSEWLLAMQTNRYYPDFVQLGKQDNSGFFSPDMIEEPDDLEYVPCLTMRQVRSAFQDAVLGLEYLHYQGIIHRDIKPANLLVSKHKRIKISDFGVSYLGKPIRDDEDASSEMRPNPTELDDARELSKTVGTPAFYAPELCYTGPEFGDEPYVPPKITGAIDIWSLGVTLYAMVFGRLPFTYDEHSLFHNIVHTPVFIPTKRLVPVEPKPSSQPGHHSVISNQSRQGIRADDELVYEEVDEELRDIIRRLLTKDPVQRITIKEIKQHPWVLRDIERPERWLTDTDPARQGDGRKIEVSNEEVTQAVTRVPFIQRVKSNVAKLGNTIFGRSSKTRLQDALERSPASPRSASGSDLSRRSSTFTLPGRLGPKTGKENIGLTHPRSGGEPHPLSDHVSASAVDNDQGCHNDDDHDGDDNKNKNDHDDDYDDDDEDDGAVFFGGGSWADQQEDQQQQQRQQSPIPQYDSSWRLSTASHSQMPAHRSGRSPHNTYLTGDRRVSQQPSLRYDEYSSFSGHKSPLSIDGSTSPFMMQGAQPQTFDTESLCARINETLVNPDDSRETSLLKQRQFQREYFHPSLANSHVDMTPNRQWAGSHSSRESDWGQHSGFIAEADTAYDYPHDPNPSTRSRSPSGARPVSSSSASHRTGTSGTSLVIPVPSMTSHASSVDGPGRRARVHVPVPDREEPPIFGRYVPAAERKQVPPAVQPESSSGSSSAEEESDDEDGLLYLGRVPRPSRIQLKK